MYVEDQDYDLLEPIYDEYPEESEEDDVYPVKEKALGCPRNDSKVSGGKDWRQVKNLLDIPTATTSCDNYGVKRIDSISIIK